MRVLRTQGSERQDWVPRLCTHRGQPYAILSHRWFEDSNHEILFADIEEIDRSVIGTTNGSHVNVIKNAQYAGGIASNKPAFKKVQGAARQALNDGYEYIWIETCCIDKNSSAELSEAINSMFKWYMASAVCYAYLVDVADATHTSEGSEFAASQWWKRGWTLQELLAPSAVTFFTLNWTEIGQRNQLRKAIAGNTGIHERVLEKQEIDTFSIVQRMSWASGRVTTRPEDIAYCLMGLFDVSMPILYGEGEKAFLRLQQEIIKESDDESIFAWRDEPVRSGLSGMLATRPAAFASSRNVVVDWTRERSAPHNLTNKGLSITLPLWRAPFFKPGDDSLRIAWLGCTTSPPMEENTKYIGILIKKLYLNNIQYARQESEHWMEHTIPDDHETETIVVRQSWSGWDGYLAIYLMDF